MKKLKLYIETSVWSHYYVDDVRNKMEDTRIFFQKIDKKKYDIFISLFVSTEIDKTEDIKRIKLQKLINKYKPTELEPIPEVYRLANKYIVDFALPRNSYDDAIHAAITSVYNLDALISWNCKHLANIVRRNKINSINIRYGYRSIDIFTPMEVMYCGK
jgi:hypothetical protein